MNVGGYFSRVRIDFGTAPRWGRLLVVLFLVAVVSVGMAVNRSRESTSPLASLDRAAADADRLASQARVKLWALADRLEESAFTTEQASIAAEADDASRAFFLANEAFGNAVVGSLRMLQQPIPEQTRRAVELRVRLYKAQCRAAAAAGQACSIAADDSLKSLAELRAAMEEHEALIVRERSEVDRLKSEVEQAATATARN